jgi:sulfate adenylyltransferase subunit 2
MLAKKNPDQLNHLDRLEAESIQIIREVVAEADNPVMLYSIGKDSAVMLELAIKAFYPAPLPFPLLHVDTTWKFQDMYRFRDTIAKHPSIRLLVHINPEGPYFRHAICKDMCALADITICAQREVGKEKLI